MHEANIVRCDQGSDRWHHVRRGIPTASRFDAIVTPTGKAATGKARNSYILELLAARISGEDADGFTSYDMERGNKLEPAARTWYEQLTGRQVEEVGFVYHESRRCGASPDGLTEHGGIEIKCLREKAHIDVLETGIIQPAHEAQIQACMWITGRATWDYVGYTDVPHMPNIIIPRTRNEAMVAVLEEYVIAFCDELDAREAALRERYAIRPLRKIKLESLSGDWCPWVDDVNMEGIGDE